ncbi:MAG: VTC domain-containing protein [Fibrobacterota bacterium]
MSRIKLSRLFFREIYTERRVCSLYFDTEDLKLYRMAAEGISERMKVRLRWYPGSGNRGCFLEFKYKKGFEGRKEVFEMPFPGFSEEDPGSSNFAKIFRDSLPEGAAVCMKSLRPVLLSVYDRRYFLASDKKVRLTFDYGLYWRKFRNKSLGLPVHSLSGLKVIELKYPSGHTFNHEKAGEAFPVRAGKVSKYAAGIETAV